MIGEKCEYCGDNVFILKNFDGRRFCLDCYDKIKKGEILLSQNVSTDDSRIEKIHTVIDRDVNSHMKNMTEGSGSVKITEKQKIVGILLILASILAIITGISMFVFGDSPELLQSYQYFEDTQSKMLQTVFYTCGTVIIIFAVVTLLGGIAALNGKLRGLTLLACVIGIFTIGPIFISSILSLTALILIVKSKNDFQSISDIKTDTQDRDRRCPSCGRIIPFDSVVCPYCGKKI